MISKKLTILIDFDNYYNKTNFIEKTSTSFSNDMRHIIDSILERNNTNEISDILIRLYSGWYKENDLTNKASSVLTKLSSVDIFPLIIENNKVSGKIELATSLFVAREYVFFNTYQEKYGLPRLRINRELLTDHCYNNRNNCPILLLHNFTKKKTKLCHVTNCPYRQSDVFFANIQKMVDTMIACDIIEFSDGNNIVYLISDDIDHIPALIQSSKKESNIYVGIKNNYKIDYYNNILNNFGINTIIL